MTVFVVGLVCLWVGGLAGLFAAGLAHTARPPRPPCVLSCPVCADDQLLEALRRGHIPDESLARALAVWRDCHDIPGETP